MTTPIETANPFHGIFAAAARTDLDGRPEGGFQPRDALTLEEAVLSYTAWPADAAFQGGSLGALRKGLLCDFIVLDRDIFACPIREAADAKVLLTAVNGEPVWQDPGVVFPEG